MSLRFLSLFVLSIFFIIQVPQGQTGCAEVDSMTEAVVGDSFKLGCISCKRREEVVASAIVDWHYKPPENENYTHIFQYKYPLPIVLHEKFEGRLQWHGTMGTEDVQIGAVLIQNVTYNDTGTYRCTIQRTLYLPPGEEYVTIIKEIDLTVVEEANQELTSVISEIMMYVVITVLQLWMIVVLIYCYKKIYDESEAREAKKAARAQRNLIDSKDSCDGVHLE